MRTKTDRSNAALSAGRAVAILAILLGTLIHPGVVLAQTAKWVQVPTDPDSTPVGREAHNMVYDEQREVVVMHGGYQAKRADAGMSDTWEWDGETWTLVSSDGPTRGHFGMAYDASRGVTVLYGGRIGPTSFGAPADNDTWEWDGESWKEIPTGEGHPLVTPAMAYDPKRGKVIRHGGISDGRVFDQDTTWEWDGEKWTKIADGWTHVGGRMIHDGVREHMALFGGFGNNLNDMRKEIRKLDGTVWDPIPVPGSAPAGRAFTGFVFDSHRGVGVLYGGAINPSTKPFSDTWEWDGEKWTRMDVVGPGERSFHAMAYDSKRKKVVVFGGSRWIHREPYLSDTWEYGLPSDPNINTPENFPDPAFRSAVEKILGVNPGEPFTADQLAEVKRIDVGTRSGVLHRDIENLKGIEFFTGLEYLDCRYNQLKTLDLSKNVALTFLSCIGNQLTTLDLSKNIALIHLFCGDNQLANLDIINNPDLELLWCNGNLLTSLDVSNNPLLSEINTSGNQLTSIAGFVNLDHLVGLDVTGNHLDAGDCEDINRLLEQLGDGGDWFLGGTGFLFSRQNGFDPYVCFDIRLQITALNPVRLSVSGPRDITVRIQRSSDLRDWELLSNLTFGEEPTILSDVEPRDTGACYYRAVWP